MAAIDNLIDEIERSYEELNAQLADPEVLGDRSRYAGIARKHAELQQVYDLARRFREAERTVADAEGLLGDDASDAEMRDFAQEELGDGRPPVLAVVEGPVVHVHADEAVGQVVVQPAAVVSGVLEGVLTMVEAEPDALVQQHGEAAHDVLAEVSAHGVRAERQR